MRSLRGLFLRPEGALRDGWKLALFLALQALLQAGARSLPGAAGLLEGSLPRLGLSIAITLLVSWLLLRSEGRPPADLGLRFGCRWGAEFLAGTALGGLLMLAVAGAVWGSGACHWERGGGPAALGTGAWLFLIVAVREELLFRGYAFQRLLDALGAWPALGLGALVFALAHGGNPGMTGAVGAWATVNIGLAGLLLGLCYLKTRSLAMPMGLHLAWNWTQGSLLGFGVSGLRQDGWLRPVLHARPDWLTGGAFGLEASLPCAVLCLLAIGGVLRWRPVR